MGGDEGGLNSSGKITATAAGGKRASGGDGGGQTAAKLQPPGGRRAGGGDEGGQTSGKTATAWEGGGRAAATADRGLPSAMWAQIAGRKPLSRKSFSVSAIICESLLIGTHVSVRKTLSPFRSR